MALTLTGAFSVDPAASPANSAALIASIPVIDGSTIVSGWLMDYPREAEDKRHWAVE